MYRVCSCVYEEDSYVHVRRNRYMYIFVFIFSYRNEQKYHFFIIGLPVRMSRDCFHTQMQFSYANFFHMQMQRHTVTNKYTSTPTSIPTHTPTQPHTQTYHSATAFSPRSPGKSILRSLLKGSDPVLVCVGVRVHVRRRILMYM